MRYKPFFDVERPLNRLLREEELKKFKSRNLLSHNLNQAMRSLAENPMKKNT